MYYCQDCGGANPAKATTCRICGLMLIHERGGSPCQSCGAPTVVNAKFCSICGTAAVAVAAASLAGVAQGGQRSDSVILAERPADDGGSGSLVNLSDGMELPDWLKRAASEQAFDPNVKSDIPVNPYGPPSGSVDPLSSVPIPENFDGLLGEEDLALFANPVGEDVVIAEKSAALSGDASDTSTFISENDLPDWIRQLAAADEAKKAEEVQRVAEAAAAERKAAGTIDPRRRRALPGETTVDGPATSPWLARRERAEAPESVAADSWGMPAAAEVHHVAPEVAPTPVTIPASTPDVVIAEQLKPAMVPTAKQPNQLKLVVIAAAVLIVVALVAFMVLS